MFKSKMFWIVLVLAAVIRGLHLGFSVESPFFEPTVLDPRYYHEWAIRILEGRPEMPVFYGLPLYPYFLAACYFVFQQSVLAVKIIQLLLGLGTLVLIYRIGSKLWAPSAGLLGMFIGAIYGPLFFHETLFIPEALGIPLYAAAFYAAICCAESPSIKKAMLTGFLCGLAALTKAGIILFVLMFVIYLALKKTKRLTSVACLAVFLAVLAPVTAHNAVRGKDLVLLTAHGGYNFYIGNNPKSTGVFAPADESIGTNVELQMKDSENVAEAAAGRDLKPSEVSSYWSAKAWEYILYNPFDFLKLSAKKIWLFFDSREISDVQDYRMAREFNPVLKFPWLSFLILGPLVFMGFAAGVRRLRFSGITALFVLSYIFSIVLFFINARYRLPLLGVFIPVAAFGLLQQRDALQSQKWGRLVFLTVVELLGFAVVLFHLVQHDGGLREYINAGDGLQQNKKYDEALSFYRKALAVDPDYSKAHAAMAHAYSEMGRWDEARGHYEAAIASDPRNSFAYTNLGMFYDKRGDLDRAEALFNKAIEVKPNNPQAHNNLGMIYGKKGQMDKAREHFEISLKLNPGSVRAMTNLGLVLYRSGEKSRARDLWRQALAIDPSFPPAKQALSLSE